MTGIWHGASWNFVVWGLLNSIIMLVSQELKPLYEKADNRLGYRKLKYYKVFEIIRTTAIVCCLQMLDYYRNIAEAFRMFSQCLQVVIMRLYSLRECGVLVYQQLII